MKQYEQRLQSARGALQEADHVIIGGGAGFSDAAGLKYSGTRFTENFSDFIKKYGLTDMYSSAFYPFKTEEERWAYWARHIRINRYATFVAPLYARLLQLVQCKAHFVITTNADHQFYKAGFSPEKIFRVQGDYAFLQCAKGCHDTLYDNEALIKELLASTHACRVPSALVPKCPVCGGRMDPHLRKDNFFIENEAWREAAQRYASFLKQCEGTRVVLLELGVGFNTPGIIRYPFEQFTYQNHGATLIRINRDQPRGIKENEAKTISFDEDMEEVMNAL